jgi:CubicO group peptidase (beta-lactamase class C family)
MRAWIAPALIGVALAAIAGCSDADPCAGRAAVEPLVGEPSRHDGDPWVEADPASVGLDAAALTAASDYSQSIYGECLLVYRKGKLVHERYYNGASATSQQKSWSIAKNVTSTLLGIALGRGQLGCVDEPAATVLPEWRDGKHDAIQLRHLLSHTSGLAFETVDDALFTISSGDYSYDALHDPVASPPGTVFAYSQRAVQVLEPVLARATGADLEAYARRYLWDPIGASPALSWDRDPVGHVPTFEGLHVTCRDLLRFGILYLDGGSANGAQLVPARYLRDATQPSQPVNAAMGYLWWLNGRIPAQVAPQTPIPGLLLPDAPADLYSATGLGQNFVDVVPSTGTVYVHMRPAPQERPDAMQIDLYQALLDDGKQQEHDELLKRLATAERP